MFLLIVLSIVYGTNDETKSLAISSSVSAAGGFTSEAACKAAGDKLLASPRPSNLELRFSCDPA